MSTMTQRAGAELHGLRASVAKEGLGIYLTGVVMLIVALAGALFVDGRAAFSPSSDFKLLAGFYVAAQAIERLVEVFSLAPHVGPENADKSKDAVAQKKWIWGCLAVLLGVGASLIFGLYFLAAVGSSGAPAWADVLVSGLLISGGTKALHELISSIEVAKEKAKGVIA